MVYDQFGWNLFKIEVKITAMMQVDISPAYYVGVLTYNDENVNSIFGLPTTMSCIF